MRRVIPRRMVLLMAALGTTVVTTAQAAPDPQADVEASYQQARSCYYDLLQNAEHQKRRDHWEACIRQFQVVAQRYPRSERAVDALFSAAKTTEQLFRASKNREDLRLAQQRYRALAKAHAAHRLADDALYRAGMIAWNGFQDEDAARKDLWRIVKWHAQGDMLAPAKQFLAQIEAQHGKGFRAIGGLLELEAPATAVATTKPAARSALHIVIDPGHGGKDPGAHGPRGTWEKDVTLAISKRLAKELKTRLGAQVTLTRTQDRTVSLDERNRIANRRRADLFVSIHANAHTDAAQHGIQTYYLNNATDQAAHRLAARENAQLGKSLTDVDHIVNTMLQNAFTEDSQQLAQQVQRGLLRNLQKSYDQIQDQQVRSALFYVLVGAKSPSILVETSYVSNPREEQRLRSTAYQAGLATGIADGIIAYLAQRTAGGTL